MSKHKYGMQKNVQNDLQQCINSFEHMKRGGIGIADELVCDTCKRALKYIDELEEKLSKSAPVRHGHWVKEKSDVLTDTDKWIEQITNLVVDVNPAEITFQAQERNLKEWCLNWQREMNMLIITAPLDYSNSKES